MFDKITASEADLTRIGAGAQTIGNLIDASETRFSCALYRSRQFGQCAEQEFASLCEHEDSEA